MNVVDTIRAASTPLVLPARAAHALWAATYDDIPNPLLALEGRTVAAMLPSLEGKFVLDVACGTGRWLGRLFARGARSGVGVDFSPEMLGKAQKQASLQGRLICADCVALPLQEGIADLAICSFAVDYVENLDRLARELSRIVRDGGDLFLADFHPSAYGRGWRRSFRYGEHLVEIASCRHSLSRVSGAFVAQGFRLETCVSPCLGEAEKLLFDRCEKRRLFDAACQGPAIFVFHFRLTDTDSLKEQRN